MLQQWRVVQQGGQSRKNKQAHRLAAEQATAGGRVSRVLLSDSQTPRDWLLGSDARTHRRGAQLHRRDLA